MEAGALWRKVLLATGALMLAGCVAVLAGGVVKYVKPPQGADEEKVAEAFEAFIKAFGSRDWSGVMAAIAEDAKLESRLGGSFQTLTKTVYGQAIRTIIADVQSLRAENTKLLTVDSTHAHIVSTITLDVAGRGSFTGTYRWEFEKRDGRWVVVRGKYL